MQPLLIDTHAHIYLPEFDDDRKAIMEAAQEAGVGKILLPAIDSATHEKMLQVEAEYSNCISMIGLHPCSVGENFAEEINVIRNYLAKRKFVAIGEIGLDFYWDKTFSNQQYSAFEQQIVLALEHQLPIVIHSRNAIDECIEVVAKYPGLRGVFHCFSGTGEQAKKIIDLNFMLGIGGVVTFKNSGLDKVIGEIGLSNIILETDAPYLAPVPFRGKRNVSAYTRLVAEKIATILSLSVKEVAEATTLNAEKLFSLGQNT